MIPLRTPLVFSIATITLNFEGDGGNQKWASREVAGKLSKINVPIPRGYEGTEITLNLTGKTLSDCVALYKSLIRVQRQARKEDVGVTFTFGGEAAGHDYPTLAKLPTPAEDHEIIRKVRNWSALTGAKILRALELMGLDAVAVKDGRKLVGFRFALPDQDVADYDYRYDSIRPDFGVDEDTNAQYETAKAWMIQTASDLLGLPNPNARAGLPTRARDYRTDLTIRTCPCCFRDIKASSHTHGFIADHGFTLQGFRRGSCAGVSKLPWEKSCEPAREMITILLVHSEQVLVRLDALHRGEVTSFKVDDINKPYNRVTRSYPQKMVTKADGYEFHQAHKKAVWQATTELRRLWDGSYASIPWYRMAVRTWKPVADDQVAVGAPEGRPEESDYLNKPDF